MSALKDQDPDYGPSVANNEKHRRIYEENARSSTARKITAIVEKEFSQEIGTKEKEVLEIQERLHRALKTLHLLRYVIISDFYNRKQCQASQSEARQTQIHPAIKRLIGKSPKGQEVCLPSTSASSNGTCFAPSPSPSPLPSPSPSTSASPSPSPSPLSVLECCDASKSSTDKSKDSDELRGAHRPSEKRCIPSAEESRPRKVPRYVPPKSAIPESPCPSRGVAQKVRKRIIVGNISKWIPPDWREDAASHKWTMYVRGNKENPDIDDFVGKVRFFLHPSYRPNDVVEVTSAPFCLSRRGWGEFPLRVQLHFKSALDKPMDIIHHLKLDRTYTGLQTLGSETVVDIWIYADTRNAKRISDKESTESTESTEFIEKEESANEMPDRAEVEAETREGSSEDRSKHFIENHQIKTEVEDVSEETTDFVDEANVRPTTKNAEKNVERSRFYVDLDHDYLGTKYLNGCDEENVTIEHPSRLSTPWPNSNDSIFQNGFCDVLSSEYPRSSPIADSTTKLRSNLRPLEISIPPCFEASGSKRVLVVQNDKTIPVDIAIGRTDDHARHATGNDTVRPKVNLTISRGVSLLKKPPIASNATDNETRSTTSSGSEAPSLRVKSSGSVLLNVNCNVPALKIADTRSPRNDRPPFNLARGPGSVAPALPQRNHDREDKEESVIRPRITLGKDKQRIQSRRDSYEEVLRMIETTRIADTHGLLRFIVSRLPIVTEDALDPEYRRLHPYACRTEEEFFGHSLAKRRAFEWNRAKMVRSFIRRRSIAEDSAWTVKEIMIWARVHGYTPACSSFAIRPAETSGMKNLPDTSSTIFTSTEPIVFQKWLRTCPERSSDLSTDITSRSNDEEINVDELEETEAGTLEKDGTTSLPGFGENGDVGSTNVGILEMDRNLIPLHDYVCETAREIGVKLVPEEIVPSVVYCAAGRVMMRAVECFVDDLLRASLAKAWERYNETGYPKLVALDDVRRAILNREEFDVFTNEGLGSRLRLATMD